MDTVYRGTCSAKFERDSSDDASLTRMRMDDIGSQTAYEPGDREDREQVSGRRDAAHQSSYLVTTNRWCDSLNHLGIGITAVHKVDGMAGGGLCIAGE